MAVIARRPPAQFALEVLWLRCISCQAPHLRIDDRVIPGRHAMPPPEGLPDDIGRAWTETQDCFAASAFTATVMLCRKLILHIAVEAGLPAKNDRDRAPTFAQALDHLQASGAFTAAMRPWVERIVNIGNEANHELPQTDAETARQIVLFLHQLLVLQYELPHKMASVGVPPE